MRGSVRVKEVAANAIGPTGRDRTGHLAAPLWLCAVEIGIERYPSYLSQIRSTLGCAGYPYNNGRELCNTDLAARTDYILRLVSTATCVGVERTGKQKHRQGLQRADGTTALEELHYVLQYVVVASSM